MCCLDAEAGAAGKKDDLESRLDYVRDVLVVLAASQFNAFAALSKHTIAPCGALVGLWSSGIHFPCKDKIRR